MVILFYKLKLIKLAPAFYHGCIRLSSKRLCSGQNVWTPLSRYLRAKIRAVGPITVAEYMKEVLTNPVSGYYMHKDVIGQQGDFVTSPEISQMFGEMVAVWLYSEWQKMGGPLPLQLVELGPGRGTLAKDILRVFARLGSLEDISLHLVEVSPLLRELQASRLCPGTNSEVTGVSSPHCRMGTTPGGVQVLWYQALYDVPTNFSCFFAHEFLDALPIHKLQRTAGGWREVLVDADDFEAEDKFRFVLSHSETPACKVFLEAEERRDQVEVSPESGVVVQQIARRLYEDGGLALFVDYGHDGTKGDTLRAFRQHHLHDPLVAPGTADITADVDFSYLRRCCGDCLTLGPVSQATFLHHMGIQARLQVLLECCRPEQRDRLVADYLLLVDKAGMGERFHFFAMFPSVLSNHLSKFPVSGFHEV